MILALGDDEFRACMSFLWSQCLPTRKLMISVATVRAHAEVTCRRDDAFPAIGWQLRICNIMIQRFLLFPEWFQDRLDCARYAHVPVGKILPEPLRSYLDHASCGTANMGRDVNMTMTDVLFARQLEVSVYFVGTDFVVVFIHASSTIDTSYGLPPDRYQISEELKTINTGSLRDLWIIQYLQVFGPRSVQHLERLSD